MLFANTKLSFILKGFKSEIKYPTSAIISHGLNIFNPLFGEPFHLVKGLFKKFSLYLCLVFKSGLYSRVGYNGMHRVYAMANRVGQGARRKKL